MSADENRNEQVEEELKDTAEAAPEEETATEDSAEAAPESEVEALKARAQEFQEQMLRSQAEMQNVRRRAEIDVEKAHKFALEKFVKELLPVADSLEKAVESTEGHESAGELVASIREGVEAPDAEPNSVVAVVQKGYTLNDRLVRPAMVVVAKAEDAPKIDEQA